MKKLIKNYTTDVPVEKTIAEIQQLLVENGARGIAIEYDEAGKIKALFFRIAVENNELPFRLPTKPEKVYRALHQATPSHYHDRYGKPWQEEAQLTLINLEQATLEEVFLPYFVVSTKKTLYQAMQEHQFQLPGGSK